MMVVFFSLLFVVTTVMVTLAPVVRIAEPIASAFVAGVAFAGSPIIVILIDVALVVAITVLIAILFVVTTIVVTLAPVV